MKVWQLKEKLVEQMWTGAGGKPVKILDPDGKILDIQQVIYDADDDQFYLVAGPLHVHS